MTTTTLLLLDRWKAHKGIESDCAAAAALKITRATVSGWRHGKSHMSVISAEKMASDLKLDVLAVLCAMEADRAHAEGTRKIWARFGRAAFMALMVGLSAQVQAVAPRPEPGYDVTPHYAKWRKRVPKSQRSPKRRPRPRRAVPKRRVVVGMGRRWI